MRLQNDLLAAHAAPAAGVAFTGFYEINGTFILRTPRSLQYFISGFIDLDEAAWGQNRIHGEIVSANVAVGEIGVSKLREISDGHQSPLLDHPSQVGGAALVEAGIHAHRNLHRGKAGESVGNVRFGRRHQSEISSHIVQVDAVPGHQLAEIAAVDY